MGRVELGDHPSSGRVEPRRRGSVDDVLDRRRQREPVGAALVVDSADWGRRQVSAKGPGGDDHTAGEDRELPPEAAATGGAAVAGDGVAGVARAGPGAGLAARPSVGSVEGDLGAEEAARAPTTVVTVADRRRRQRAVDVEGQGAASTGRGRPVGSDPAGNSRRGPAVRAWRRPGRGRADRGKAGDIAGAEPVVGAPARLVSRGRLYGGAAYLAYLPGDARCMLCHLLRIGMVAVSKCLRSKDNLYPSAVVESPPNQEMVGGNSHFHILNLTYSPRPVVFEFNVQRATPGTNCSCRDGCQPRFPVPNPPHMTGKRAPSALRTACTTDIPRRRRSKPRCA